MQRTEKYTKWGLKVYALKYTDLVSECISKQLEIQILGGAIQMGPPLRDYIWLSFDLPQES